MKVGVIGLGAMGVGLADSLLRAGHEVTVWNRSKAPAEALQAKGARVAATPADAFQGDAAVTMLANDEAIREVILDAGVLGRAAPGLIHLVSATISVALARELEQAHAEAGVTLVSAPVLGRPDLAEKGELNILAAGATADIAKVQPVLDAIGRKTWTLGEQPHLANVAKLAANFMIAANIEVLAEAFAFAEKQGLDPRKFFELATGTIFGAPVVNIYGALILDRAFEPAKFKLPLGLKDVRLALAAGEAAEVPLPFASVLRDNFVDALANGGAGKDWSALSEVAFRRAGLG
jgi:3-hydroxyisobutyrate dehydrogenase-like beta-hydroxyacid dehydrogenase